MHQQKFTELKQEHEKSKLLNLERVEFSKRLKKTMKITTNKFIPAPIRVYYGKRFLENEYLYFYKVMPEEYDFDFLVEKITERTNKRVDNIIALLDHVENELPDLENFSTNSYALLNQITTISKSRIKTKILKNQATERISINQDTINFIRESIFSEI